MNTNSGKLTPLTSEQIEASKQRLLNEGFTAGSKAVRVHDQLLALMAAHEVNTSGAVKSIEALKAECEKLREALQPYATAHHRRIHVGNEQPGCELRVWVSDHVRARDALGLNPAAVDDRPDANLSVRKAWDGV
jgi:hypothetical protein